MGEPKVEAFLTHLAVNRRVAESTQNQTLGAILFLYRHVLEKDLGSLDDVRANRPKRLPTVLSKEEVQRLIVELLYGTGMRISECCQLRVCDLAFDRGQIIIRGGKGNKDRVTMLPQSLETRLKTQVEFVRLRHEHDVEHGTGYAPVSTSLEHKRHGPAREIRWYAHPGAGAARSSKPPMWHRIGKRVTCHTLQHSFATHLLETVMQFVPFSICSTTRTSKRR